MPWVKIDEHFYDHPKWATAPGDSIALWLASMAWCNRNDSTSGFIPAVKLSGLVHIRNVRRTAADLVTRGAYHPHTVDGVHGYLIHDYQQFQQPEKVRAIAAKRSAAGQAGARARWQTDHPSIANSVANSMANAIAKTCPVNRQPSTDVSNSGTESSRRLTAVPPTSDDDDLEAVLAIITNARIEGRTGVRNPRAYRNTVLTEARQQDGELARSLLADGSPLEQVALFILGHGLGAEEEHIRTPDAWCTTECERCGGDQWIWMGEDDRPHPCPNGPRAKATT